MARTAQQTKNLHDWLHVKWPAIPVHAVAPRLSLWREPTNCGTVHCFGGWVAIDEDAQEQGIRADLIDGAPISFTSEGGRVNAFRTGINFFGLDGLFDPRMSAIGVDATMPRDATDHAIVLNRLRYAVEHPECDNLLSVATEVTA